MTHRLRTIAALLCVAALPVAALPVAALPAGAQRSDPDAVRISTDDVTRFVAALDSLRGARSYRDSANVLWRVYYLPASPGLRSFIRSRIGSPFELLDKIETRTAYYRHLPIALAGLRASEPGIRAAFRRFKAIYPDARFADVYFVVGRMTSGGTTGRDQILLGAEMFGRDSTAPTGELSGWERTVIKDARILPNVAVHELMHVNQPDDPEQQPSLLLAALREGGADFVADLVTDGGMNEHIHRWADPREAQLWAEFRPVMNGTKYTGWLYGGESGDRPADLGYYVGYRIAKAYYDRAADKTQAIRDILGVSDGAAFLAKSGYDPR